MTGRLLERLTVATPEEMHELGLRLARNLKAGDLVLLTGPLGAGKTTLTRGVGEGLGTIGTVSSPTFVIARTHQREGSQTPLVHVDAYRLSNNISISKPRAIDFSSADDAIEPNAAS